MVAADLPSGRCEKVVERKDSSDHLLNCHKANFALRLLSEGEEMASDYGELPS